MRPYGWCTRSGVVCPWPGALIMNPLGHDQVGHIARLAVLSMFARGVAAAEFDSNPEVQAVAVIVRRSAPGESLPVDMEFIAESGAVLGGVTL